MEPRSTYFRNTLLLRHMILTAGIYQVSGKKKLTTLSFNLMPRRNSTRSEAVFLGNLSGHQKHTGIPERLLNSMLH
jgi:hypothetical protein